MKARLVFLIIVSLLIFLEYQTYYLSRGYAFLLATMIFLAINVMYAVISKARYQKRNPPHTPEFRPFVSLIVPAKNEEKVIFLEENKKNIKNKLYLILFIMLIPTTIIVLNIVLDSEESKNIACGVYEKELIQNKKSGPSYLIKVKCTNKSEYDLRVNTETWNKEKQGDTIIITTTKGGLGLERIKKISY